MFIDLLWIKLYILIQKWIFIISQSRQRPLKFLRFKKYNLSLFITIIFLELNFKLQINHVSTAYFDLFKFILALRLFISISLGIDDYFFDTSVWLAKVENFFFTYHFYCPFRFMCIRIYLMHRLIPWILISIISHLF